MTDDFSLVLLAACGLGLICFGVFIIGGFALTRFAGLAFIGPIFGALRGYFQPDREEEEGYTAAPRRRSPSAAELRAQAAQSLDFDAALQKYQQNPPAVLPDADKLPPQAQLPPVNVDGFNKSPYGVRDTSDDPNRRIRDKRYRRNAADMEDEIMGGLLEDNANDDGDGLF